jgi:hypothetical protein
MNYYTREHKAINRKSGPNYPEHGNYAHQPSGDCPSNGRRPAHPHPIGGQYRSPAGVRTTIDSLSDDELREDHRRRLADFERERKALCGGNQ